MRVKPIEPICRTVLMVRNNNFAVVPIKKITLPGGEQVEMIGAEVPAEDIDDAWRKKKLMEGGLYV